MKWFYAAYLPRLQLHDIFFVSKVNSHADKTWFPFKNFNSFFIEIISVADSHEACLTAQTKKKLPTIKAGDETMTSDSRTQHGRISQLKSSRYVSKKVTMQSSPHYFTLIYGTPLQKSAVIKNFSSWWIVVAQSIEIMLFI